MNWNAGSGANEGLVQTALALRNAPVTVDSAMRMLEAVDRWVRSSSRLESIKHNPALDWEALDESFQVVWRHACHTRSPLVEATTLKQAGATARAVLHHVLELALIERCRTVVGAPVAPLGALLLAAQAALWQLRWTLFDYRRPDPEWIHAIALCHALLRFSDPQGEDQHDLHRRAMLTLSQCFMLAASDPNMLSPRELHDFANLLPMIVREAGEPRIARSCNGPVAILDLEAHKIGLARRLGSDTPLLHLPLRPLLKLLAEDCDAQRGSSAIANHLLRRLGGGQGRASARERLFDGAVRIGFMPILGAGRRPMHSDNSPQTTPSSAWTVSDYSDSGARVRQNGSGCRPQPGQLASLEIGALQQRYLAVVRWVRRERGTSLSMGLEFLHSDFAVEVLRSEDSTWPSSGLRTQQAIVAGRHCEGTPKVIDVFIGLTPDDDGAPLVPQKVTVIERDLSFSLAGDPVVLNGHAWLRYRRVEEVPALQSDWLQRSRAWIG